LWLNVDMQNKRPHWSPRLKLTVVLMMVGFGLFLLYLIRAAIAPLVIAVLLAFILAPIIGWFQNRLHTRRSLAALLVYLILLLVISVIPLVIIPPLAAQSTALSSNIQQLIKQTETFVGRSYYIAGYTINIQVAIERAIGSLQGLVQPIFSQTLQFAMEAISSMVWVVFITVVSFYLAKDAPALNRWLDHLPPVSYREDFIRLRGELNLVWSSFLRGQITLALVVLLIFTTAGFILGLPFALAMGALAGALEFIPSLGHGIWLACALILALFAGSTWMPIPNWIFALIILGLHLFYQQFDLNYLIPRIVGRRVRLPPLVIILGIVIGALTAGVLGVLLAAPTIASARVLGRYIYANLLDEDPFPKTNAPDLPAPNPRWWRKTSTPEVEDKQG
jgi:predicted PurR-regulated permease PerM